MEKHFCDWCHKEISSPAHLRIVEERERSIKPQGEYCDYECAIAELQLELKQREWDIEFENWMNSYHDRVPGKSPWDVFLEEHGCSPCDAHESPPYKLRGNT